MPGSHALTQAPPLQSAALLHMHFLLSGKQLWPTPHALAAVATVHAVWPQLPRAPLQVKPVLGQSAGAKHGSEHCPTAPRFLLHVELTPHSASPTQALGLPQPPVGHGVRAVVET